MNRSSPPPRPRQAPPQRPAQQRQAPQGKNRPRQAPPPPGQAKRPPLSPAQRRKREAERKRNRRRAFRSFRLYCFCTLTVYLLFVLLALGVIGIKLHSFPETKVQEHNLFWANKEQDEFSSKLEGKLYGKDTLLHDGMLYLSTELLLSYTSLSEGGNHAVRTLYLGDEQALFFLNTTTVQINGQYTSLSAPSILKDGKLCVPLDFFSRCVTGLEITVDEENDRYVVKNTGEVSFSFKEDLPENAIAYETYLNLVKPDERK